MMDISELEAAILSKDPDAVVAAMAEWNEEQRQAANDPFNVFVLALGLEHDVVQPCRFTLTHTDVLVKRQRDDIQEMDKTSFDHELSSFAWLASSGLDSSKFCRRFLRSRQHGTQVAQILTDRNPPWWNEIISDAKSGNPDISGEYWAVLYDRGIVSEEHFPAIAKRFAQDLVHMFKAVPLPMQRVLREIDASREFAYSISNDVFPLFSASLSLPVLGWLQAEGLLDGPRFLRAVIDALHEPLNQTERNGCLGLLKAVKPGDQLLAEFQSDWMGLVSDSQASVAGFAVQTLGKIEKSGRLNAAEAINALPAIFSHKAKSHAKTAVEILNRIAEDELLRSKAVQAGASGLMHPNKDVQKSAIDVLQKHLKPDDTQAIELVSMYAPSIAPTLAKEMNGLLCFGEDASDQSSPVTQEKCAQSGSPVKPEVTLDINMYRDAAKIIPSRVRELLRLDEALDSAEVMRIDHTCRWRIQDMGVLASTPPIQPIETVEELIDVTSAAVEQCDCGDTVDRIVGGIARLYRNRPKSFESMTASLKKRACSDPDQRPQRAIVAPYIGEPFSWLINAWLDPNGVQIRFGRSLPGNMISAFLVETANRVRQGIARALLSEPTHSGGWIDPRVWVERLMQVEKDEATLFKDDLQRSLLRLTPDGREEALAACESLTGPVKKVARIALGGEVEIDDSFKPPVWIATLRARDAFADLTEILDRRVVIEEPYTTLPDVIRPSDYQWRMYERTDWSSHIGPVVAWPNSDTVLEDDHAAAHLRRCKHERSEHDHGNFFTASLHDLFFYFTPAFAYPYIASQWPMKLDWHWSKATEAFARRIDNKSSVMEPYGQFLLPLLEIDRPVTTMAARALWIATISKDENSRSMAIEVWISVIETDRVDLQTFGSTLQEIATGGWVKWNRVAEVFEEIAAVSPLHAWTIASLLETILASFESLPRSGGAPLVELLNESCERLGRAVSHDVKPILQSIKSGKAKIAAKSLLDRPDQITSDREAAVTAAMNARLARAERMVHNPSDRD